MVMENKNITVSAGVSRVAAHRAITPTMVDDFIIDPVLAAYVILGIKLDPFQACRLRLLWWTPNVIDSSGFGTGKSLVLFIFFVLRAVLIGDQHLCVYYQTFNAAQTIFWPYFSTFDARRSPLFAAQLGNLDFEGEEEGKANTKGPACYKQHFKNESIIFAPAPNWFQDAKGQAGQTFNGIAVDEWTKVETMTKKTSRTTNEKGDVVGGINQQIIGRVRRTCWNQYHPLWMNRRVFLATAESLQHPAASRYKNFLKLVASGDPNYAVFSACFKDFSNIPVETDIRIEDVEDDKGRVIGRELRSNRGKPFKEVVPDWSTISDMKNQFTVAHFRREGLGLWARETQGWYSESDLERCVALGLANGVEPETARPPNCPDNIYYFMGIDPAKALGKKSDDGAMAVLRVRPRPGLSGPPTSNRGDWLPEFVWARRVRGEKRLALQEEVLIGQTAGQWSGLIHQKHQQFNLTGLLMDKGGGGDWIYPELAKNKQLINGLETAVMPITTPDDLTGEPAHLILNLYRRRDPGIEQVWPLLQGDDNLAEAMHIVFKEAVEHALLAFPLPFNERPASTTAGWTAEMRWALICLDAGRAQLMDIQALMNDNGTWALTSHGAKQFSATGKKDIAYAMILAYVRFLIWIKNGGLENQGDPEEVRCYA